MAGEELLTPRDFVADGWTSIQQQGQHWLTWVQTYLAQFEGITLAPMTFEVPPELDVEAATFTRPTAPDAPADTAVSVTMPDAPSLSDVVAPTVTTEPTAPTFDVSYAKPAAPNRALPELPSDTNPVLDAIEVPDAPTISLPDEPVLYVVDLPDVPDLSVPEFEGIRPVRDFDVPAETFAWTYGAYDATTINTIKASLSDMRINGLALPADVEQAIFDRARGREDTLTAQAVGQFTDELAGRVRPPAGLLARGLDRIRSEARTRSSTANRDIAIEIAKQNVEAIRFSVAQGIALETELVRANLTENELKLRGAQAAQDVAIAIFNARVTLHNAEWEGFKVDAQVFESRIRALDAQASLYKSQVDAQKTIGDLNESLVRAYGETVRSRSTLVDIYKAQVEAAVARGTINTQRLDQARLRLQGFQTQVDAWGKEWEGYKTSVEAELGNLRAQETLANVYAKRVEVWSTANKLYFDAGRFEIETQGQQLERYRAQLTGAQVDAQVQLAAADAVLRRYATQGQIFAAEGQVAAAESAAQDRTQQLRIEAARLRIGTVQKNLELTADYALKGVDAQIEVVKAKAGIVSQLAASSQSGINFGASYNGSLGWGFSKSASMTYSGEAPEFNSVPPNLNF